MSWVGSRKSTKEDLRRFRARSQRGSYNRPLGGIVDSFELDEDVFLQAPDMCDLRLRLTSKRLFPQAGIPKQVSSKSTRTHIRVPSNVTGMHHKRNMTHHRERVFGC